MRELKYFVACTVDRFIAREDGSFDFFLAEGAHLTDLVKRYPETVPAHLRDALGVRPAHNWVDTVLMGRKTYDVGLPFGVKSPYPHSRAVRLLAEHGQDALARRDAREQRSARVRAAAQA